MPTELLAYYLRLPVFMLVVARLAGMVMFQPILSAQGIPATVRAVFVVGLGVLVTPFVDLPEQAPDTLVGLVVALAGELLLGSLIGLVVAVAFVGVQMGGTLVAQETGLAFGEIVDPTSDQHVSVLSSFYMQLAGVVYLIVGGHRALLATCLQTFHVVPLLADTGATAAGADVLVGVLTVAGITAIRLAAPIMLTLFLVNVAMGFIARTVPQLNVTTVGFALKGLIAFVLMAISLPSALAAFTDGLDLGFDYLQELLGT